MSHISKDKTVFFGTSEFAIPALDALLKNDYEIIAVITAPDKPVGRRQALTPPPIKSFAIEKGLNVFQPPTLKSDEFFEDYKKLMPDLGIVAAYGKIIPQRYIDLPKHGLVNIHPSLLPKYRGPSPIQGAIMNGEEKTSVTIMLIDADMDHGPILAQKEYAIDENEYFPKIHDDLARIGADLLIETLPQYIEGKIKPREQNHDEATFTKMIKREHGKIDWQKPAIKIYNQIRALNPEPGTWTLWNNQILNITRAKELFFSHQTNTPPGTIEKIDGQIAVTCLNSYLALERIQLSGKKEMTAKDFLNGHSDFLLSQLI